MYIFRIWVCENKHFVTILLHPVWPKPMSIESSVTKHKYCLFVPIPSAGFLPITPYIWQHWDVVLFISSLILNYEKKNNFVKYIQSTFSYIKRDRIWHHRGAISSINNTIILFTVCYFRCNENIYQMVASSLMAFSGKS